MKFQSAILVALSLATVACESVHIIGARVKGDQLLINDTLYERTKSIQPTNHTIVFQYPVNKLVSYIELSSNSNVHTKFGLTHDNILYGMVTAMEIPEFEVKIRVYGVDEEDAPPNFHPVITPDRDLERLMEPYDDNDDEYYDSENMDDNTLALGDRQPGDELLYETYQHSYASIYPERHSVVFYYIDTYFLTHAEFLTIHTSSASANFSQVSHHSIKAVIYDDDVRSLDVRLRLYGFQPHQKPADYRPMISVGKQNDAIIRKAECSPLALKQFNNSSVKFNSNLFFVVLSIIVFYLVE